jgi:hypothetical protein
MKTLIALIQSLPTILKIIEHVQKANEKAQTDRKVKEDLALVEEAFREKDAEKLNKIFNS